MMKKGRKAFEAIAHNQNSTESREQQEVTSNGKGGEDEGGDKLSRVTVNFF